MPRHSADKAKLLAAFVMLLSVAQSAGVEAATIREREFPLAATDYFAAMDDGVRLDAEGVRGRNTWLLWTVGDEGFWDLLATESFGAFVCLACHSRAAIQRSALEQTYDFCENTTNG
jgi:hypothetical protein